MFRRLKRNEIEVPDEVQASYHEQEARKCEAKLRELIPYPSTYQSAYNQTMKLIKYHREQAHRFRVK